MTKKGKKMENLKLVEFSNIHGISVSEAEKRKNQNLNTIFFLKLIKRNQSADRYHIIINNYCIKK